MNILIKLTCLIGLVLAPILGQHEVASHSSIESKTIEVEQEALTGIDDSETFKAEFTSAE